MFCQANFNKNKETPISKNEIAETFTKYIDPTTKQEKFIKSSELFVSNPFECYLHLIKILISESFKPFLQAQNDHFYNKKN